jgi:two-component system, LytTR family, response regulator LytT
MNVVIIEDELLTAHDLSEALQQLDPAIAVNAILPSVQQAMVYFSACPLPDLVFSDIQLGDGVSFEIFQKQCIHVPVIFCTAYDTYALDAFRANGIDYLLKPFTNASLHHTLQKFRQLQLQFTRQQAQYQQVMEYLQQQFAPRKSTILVYQNERIIPLPIQDIALFFVQDKLTRVVCLDQHIYTISQPLDELEGICGLPFYRANRQYLINRKAIREVACYYGRKLLLQLTIQFKEKITISKDKYIDFLQWLSHA